MSLKIENISNENMLKMVQEFDKDQNGELGKEEYSIFQQAAQKALESKKISEEDYTNAISNYKTGFKGWLKDDDKVCTDTKNDGKIGFKEALKYIGKGCCGGILKNVINHPIASGLGVLGFIAIAEACPVLLFALAGAATLYGVSGTAAYLIHANVISKNDGDTKKSYEEAGTAMSTGCLGLAGKFTLN